MRVSKPSLMEEAAAIPLGYITAVDSSPQCFSIDIGHGVSPFRISGSFLEGENDILTPANDHGAASMNAKGFTTLDHESDNVGQHSCGQYMEALGTDSSSDCHTLSVHSDTLRQYSPASQVEKGRDQEKDLSTGTETGVATAAIFLRQTAVPLLILVAKYRCATKECGYAQIRVGKKNLNSKSEEVYIPRWLRGSELTYTVDALSFPTFAKAMQVKAAMQKAIDMWGNIDVSFKYLELGYYDSATFVVKYDDGSDDPVPSDTYAMSFFPDESPGDLLVYKLALTTADHLANILAHEIGHILGLRHEFADENHKEGKALPCVLFGKKNPRSIMDYYEDPGQLQVSEQDLQELEEFYAYNGEKYEKLPIRHCVPISHGRSPPKKTRTSSF